MSQAILDVKAPTDADLAAWVRDARTRTLDLVADLSDEQLMSIAAGRHVENAGVLEVQYNRLFEKPKQVKPPSK